MIIRAECHTDDYVAEIEFDAVKWFEQASDEEIMALAECSYGGDYPADYVAEFFSRDATAEVFQYLHLVNRRNSDVSGTIGFECHIDPSMALDWVKKNRPALYDNIKPLDKSLIV